MKRFAFFILVLLAALPASAQTFLLPPSNSPPAIQLNWLATVQPNQTITNYNLWEGVGNLQYTNKIPAGTNLSLVLTNLVRGTMYHFNLTCVDSSGLESQWAYATNDVSYTVPVPPTPPTGFSPIVVLIVQSSPVIKNPTWVNVANLGASPTGPTAFYRLLATQYSP